MSAKQEVINFGCRLNIYEGEIIKNHLRDSKLANVVVFNTCSVTQEAEKQGRAAIRRYRRQNPEAKIIVTGCAAQNDPNSFIKMPQVDQVIGNEEKLFGESYLSQQPVVVNDIMAVQKLASHMVQGFDGKSRAFIQVQNGCDHRCTFCIIPYGRGNSRSAPIGDIVKQIKILLAQNYQEIVLTGVDVTAYGADLPGSPTFAQMIRRVLALVPELKRLRLSSIDVAEIDQELFELMATEMRLMPHFHISLQAGDDMILKRMKRRHRRQQVIDFCHALRQARPGVAFGADIIAGFPTETAEMFANTQQLIEEAAIQYLHVFPYSARQGTPAARMPQVETIVRKQRAKILRQTGEIERDKFFQAKHGCIAQLLVEQNNLAHCEHFIPVKITDSPIEPGTIVKGKLIYAPNQPYMLVEIL